nr:RHS repeat-associated core domain-containing protein [Aliiglaciecola lipolytica]
MGEIYKREVYLGELLSTGWVFNSRWEEGALLVKNEVQWDSYKLGTSGCHKQLNSPNYSSTPHCRDVRKIKEFTSYKADNGYDTYFKEYIDYSSYFAISKYKETFSNSTSLPSDRIDEISSISGNSRFTLNQYQHNKDQWLLDKLQQSSISETDSGFKVTDKYVLDNTTLNTKEVYKNGFKTSSFEYFNSGNNKGALKSIKSSINRINSSERREVSYSDDYNADKPYESKTYNRTKEEFITSYQEADSFGRVTKKIDYDQVTTHFTYDNLGRLISKDIANDSLFNNSWLDLLTVWDDVANTKIVYLCTLNATRNACSDSPSFKTTEFYDALGRLVSRKTEDLLSSDSNTKVRYENFEYNTRNQVTFSSFVSFDPNENKGIRTEYDVLNRKQKVITSGQGTISYAYLTGNEIQVNDGESNVTTTTYQAFGSPSFELATKIASPEGVTTDIEIDVFGLTKSVTQSGHGKSFTETRKYDTSNQLCLIQRADVGNTVFKYNPLGELVWQKHGVSDNHCVASAPSGSTYFVYDNLGDMYKINYPGSDLDVTYERDNRGNVTTLTAGNIIQEYSYNNLNLLEDETLTIGAEGTLEVDYTYNNLTHIDSVTYPDGTQVNFKPNGFGSPTQAISPQMLFAEDVKYHGNGMIHTFTYGNGVKHTTSLNSTSLLPREIKDVRGNGNIVNLSYTYDDNGNLKSITDRQNTSYSLTNLAYDGLDRVTGVTGGSSIGNSSISYDALGNIKNYTSKGRSLNYSYHSSNNRLTSVTGTGTNGKYGNIQYDDRGNIKHNGTFGLTFNAANQLSSAKGNSYLYDGHNRRVKQVDGNGTRYSMYSQSGVLLYQEKETFVGNGTSNIYLGKKLIAKYGDVTPQPLSNSRQHFRPFGETIETPKDDIGYSGHKFDTDLGLSYMQARYYDPMIGRFYSNDPVGFTNVHTFNRYAYANNNPYKYVDPDGKAAGTLNKLWEKMKGIFTVGPVDAYQVGIGKHKDFAVSVSNQFVKSHGNGLTKAQKERLKNGIRHVAWQASITLEEGLESAVEIGRLHELGETESKDSKIDQHNNIVGQSIGQNSKDLDEVVSSIATELATGSIITTWTDPRINQSLPNFVGSNNSSYGGSGSDSSGGSDSSTSSCSSGSYPNC